MEIQQYNNSNTVMHSINTFYYYFFFGVGGGGGGGGGKGNATFIYIARSCRIGQYKATIMRYAQLD